MKQQKVRNLVILAVMLLALSGAYMLLLKKSQEVEEAKNALDSEYVLRFDTSRVASIQFTLEGDAVTFVKRDDKWSLEGDADFEVAAGAVENRISSMANLMSERTLEDVTDLSEYGLDAPSQTVVLKMEQGEVFRVFFGDSNEATGNDYVYVDGDAAKVFTVESGVAQAFAGTLEDYRAESTEESTDEDTR